MIFSYFGIFHGKVAWESTVATSGIDEAGLKALEQVMRKRPELTISLAGQFDDDSQLQLPGMCEE